VFDAGHGGWIPKSNDNIGGWIQVDLLTSQQVTGIITQGRADENQYAKSFTIYYGNDDYVMQPIVKSSGQIKVFQGNFDRNTKVVNFFPQPVTARFIRYEIASYYDHPALRMELLSC
jgi:hypothetical protein